MNKTEEAYANRLQVLQAAGEIQTYSFERIKVKLGKDCWYTPDFLVMAKDGVLELHEVKKMWRTRKGGKEEERPGYREDARVKIVSAADDEKRLPFRFIGAYLQRDGTWVREEF